MINQIEEDKKIIEVVRKYELGEYEIIKESLSLKRKISGWFFKKEESVNLLRFRINAGVVYGLTPGVILDHASYLKQKGLYKKAQTAQIIQFSDYKKAK